MSKNFFIMLRNGDKAMSIVDENEEVMLYESKFVQRGRISDVAEGKERV